MNIETICKHCIFALWDTQKIPTEQTGCYFDRLSKFEKIGIKVEKREIIPGLPAKQQHYTIGAMCNRCFMSDGSGKSIEEYAKIAVEKSRLQFDFIYAPKNVDAVRNVAGSLSNLDSKPNQLILLDRYNLNKKEIYDVISKFHLKWITVSGLEASIDDAIDNCESEYFWVINDDTEGFPKDILQLADNIWNEKMIQFFCVHGKYGTLVNYDMYKMFVAKWDNDPINKFLTIDERFKLNTGKRTYTWDEVL